MVKKTTPYNGRMNREKVERRMTANPNRKKKKEKISRAKRGRYFSLLMHLLGLAVTLFLTFLFIHSFIAEGGFWSSLA
jgi:hypothetical protein